MTVGYTLLANCSACFAQKMHVHYATCDSCAEQISQQQFKVVRQPLHHHLSTTTPLVSLTSEMKARHNSLGPKSLPPENTLHIQGLLGA